MTVVSVIVPAFRAGAGLVRALDSVAACGWPEDRVEIVIAPDDGAPYAAHADGWGRRVILPPGPVASGPGPTRNRALAAATGQVVAFLDADDSWAPGYLAALVPLALAHGAAFGRTEVRDKDAVLMTVPSGATLGFDDLGGGASFHPVLRRDWAGPFANAPSQDVFHAVEALSLAGGCAPVGAATYRLHVTPGSATSGADYGARVAAAYAEYGQRIRSGASRVPPALQARAAAVFDRRAQINAAYLQKGSGRGFYDVLADQLSGGISPSPRR